MPMLFERHGFHVSRAFGFTGPFGFTKEGGSP